MLSRLLEALSQPLREQRFRAALAILLSTHVFERLDAKQRVRVEDELVAVYRPLGVYPWWRSRKDQPDGARAAERAVAMQRLEVPTGIEGLSWSEIIRPAWRANPALLSFAYRPFHPATDRAIAFLAERGVVLAERHMVGSAWFAAMKRKYP
jgi:hypothetical protein